MDLTAGENEWMNGLHENIKLPFSLIVSSCSNPRLCINSRHISRNSQPWEVSCFVEEECWVCARTEVRGETWEKKTGRKWFV